MKKNRANKQLREPTVKTAAIYALFISIMIYLLFMIAHFYGRSAVVPFEQDHKPPPITTIRLLYGVVATYLYIFFLFCLNFYILRKNFGSNGLKTVVAISVSILFIFAWSWMIFIVQSNMLDIARPNPRAMRGGIMRDMVLGGIVIFTSQFSYLNYRRQLMSLENEALKAEYARARYESLKSQIDPHFLFNTLNTLNFVIANDPQTAQKYVQKLSSIFRYTIQSKDVATLREELVFTKDYCDLMQIRYGGNLKFVFDVSEECYSRMMVPFSIQTLVENAIKHNVITDRQPLIVEIRTTGEATVVVSNRISPKKDPDKGEGIGLANLSERYKLKWGRDITICDDDEEFSVTLPLIEDYQIPQES